MKNFETAPFPPYPLLAGLSLAECRKVIGGQSAIPPDRDLLWLRQGGRCFYCDEPMVRHKFTPRRRPPDNAMTEDHILTRANGGRLGPKVAACRSCNALRGTIPAHDFIDFIMFRARAA